MITCNQYDYIEIACMYRYPIKLTLRSAEVITGIAQDTGRNSAGEECINVSVSNNETMIVLTEITKLEACSDNPHFSTLSFD
ncbi:Rho-binding antiterminator [Paraglaciecola aquimarina]|uniref:Rho-binding antiterminator n=1 Tax=Paraglaciecola aquimarina TaxID=1235557 RepID=A0ABU3SZ99_9ALTE|nr:Rho-binding antiterminator [Paraglaciecola aquimarina]MDU0355344.1 Rho-binding antiterminator [Paraglaciecola aquimarina]